MNRSPGAPAFPSPATTSQRVKLAAACATSTAIDDPPSFVALGEAIAKSKTSTLVVALLIVIAIASASPLTCVFFAAS
ncbi:MAG: hypothetical protein KDA22_14845 [Phycisphaerales bacterium]|nr:hypothetical protein [Phycisphaerales bacterium]